MVNKIFQLTCNCCSICDIYIQNKSCKSMSSGKLGLLDPATIEVMLLDTIGSFGVYRSLRKYLHLLVNHFTRYTHF